MISLCVQSLHLHLSYTHNCSSPAHPPELPLALAMTPRTSNERGATPDIDHDGQSGSPAKRRRTKSPTTGPTSEDSSSSPASAVERTFKPVFPVKAKSVWTPEKQAILLDDIIKAGTKAADLDALAERVSILGAVVG